MTVETPSQSTFELRGEYGGFYRTLLGQRRMLLRRGEEETLLKVPKELRRIIEDRLVRGQAIVVQGAEEIEKRSGLPRLVVSRVQYHARNGDSHQLSSRSLVCPIRVCSKKNCWRSGGKELAAALGQALRRSGLGEMVEIHEVSCLGYCERAPNCDWGNHEFHRCSPGDAAWIVERIRAEV